MVIPDAKRESNEVLSIPPHLWSIYSSFCFLIIMMGLDFDLFLYAFRDYLALVICNLIDKNGGRKHLKK